MVVSTADADHVREPLAHQALLYGTEAEFLESTVPFVRDGLDEGAPIRVVTTSRAGGWLRAALGADAQRVEFVESSDWYLHPVRALTAIHRRMQAGVEGRRLRMIGEPFWTARTAQESREWARYEALVNTALASVDAAIICPYDTRAVDPEVVANACRTHPEVIDSGGARPSTSYVHPAVFSAECDRSPLSEPPPSAVRLPFSRAREVASVRAFVASYATWAGATQERVEELVLAVGEAASNAIEHGGGSGVLRVWAGPQTMSCEISDTGSGLRDRLAGHLPPDRLVARGGGLWLTRQLCDLVELRSGPAGTTVRLHLALH